MKIKNKDKKGLKFLNFYIDDNAKIDDALNFKLKFKKERVLRDLRIALREALLFAKKHNTLELKVDVEQLSKLVNLDKEKITEELVIQFGLADYAFDKFKGKKEARVKELVILNAEAKAIKRAQSILEAVLYARDLANMPGSKMTPEVLAQEAKKIAKSSKSFKVKVLGKKELEKINAGALLAVGSASKYEPKLIVLEYNLSRNEKPDLVFVGKGITFDTGGLDIKPAGKFVDMFQDMSGAGSLLALAKLLPALNVQRKIVILIPAAENAVGSESYRPGDILETVLGKTIEVGHTDAEGRLILADAIGYAKKYNAEFLITVATLTGAALVALGQEANAIMSNDEELAWSIREWSEDSGDYAWPLPLWDEYTNIMKGTFADLNNVQNNGSKSYGGTVTAGAFLYEFAKEVSSTFLHIDMAPRMVPGPNDKLPKVGGALGGPVRLLLDLIERRV